MSKPLGLMDVDGVLNPKLNEARAAALGYRPEPYTGPAHPEVKDGAFVWFHPDHKVWLHELAACADLVWVTSWLEHTAWLATLYDLPTDLPYVECGRYGDTVTFGRNAKSDAVRAYVGDRPFVWFDDSFGGKDLMWADDRTDEGVPTLMVGVERWTGLAAADMDQARSWLARNGWAA